jgi:hypothetical protein
MTEIIFVVLLAVQFLPTLRLLPLFLLKLQDTKNVSR